VTLNGMPVAAGVTHTITRVDYYDLFARRVLTAGGVVSSQLVRFIVLSSNRGNGSDHPERGLIEFLPFPPIPSGSNEFAGASLTLWRPQIIQQAWKSPWSPGSITAPVTRDASMAT
jgi:hypothetical protein